MAVHGEVVLRQRVCCSRGCQTVFWICTHCDRGQCYCSPACRTEARRRQHRAANRRYQQSLEGRLDHRDRQQQYRERRCRPRVTDQSSLSVISPAPFGCGETITPSVVVPLPSGPPERLEKRTDLWLHCSICGRPGRFVDGITPPYGGVRQGAAKRGAPASCRVRQNACGLQRLVGQWIIVNCSRGGDAADLLAVKRREPQRTVGDPARFPQGRSWVGRHQPRDYVVLLSDLSTA